MAWKEDAVHKSMMSSLPQFYRTKQIVFHCSLNSNPQEKISDDSLREIARDFMTEMGYANQPYIVFKHNDIEREHIHIVSLRVDSNGKKINDKYEGIRSSKAVRKIEKKIRSNNRR